MAYSPQPLSSAVLRYGTEDAPPAPIPLRAGPLSLLLEDGALRSIRYGDHELIRQIYVAVRDQHWGTVGATLSHIELRSDAASFALSYDATHSRQGIDFRWHATITGAADGTISWRMDGQAHSTFLRNRIGFCVLHPSMAAGADCMVEHADGSIERARLPQQLIAEQPVPHFAELRALRHRAGPGLEVELRFSGDVFEMEDQRNWTDASFKTFCTPLRLPFPVEIPAGSRIRQSITLTTHPGSGSTAPASADDRLRFSWGTQGAPLPAIGLGTAGDGRALERMAIERLRALRLTHLRVDLPLGGADIEALLDRAAGEARELGVKLQPALLLPDHADAALGELSEAVRRIRPPVSSWLIYPAVEAPARRPPHAELLALARRYLEHAAPGAGFAAGTNTDFFFLNRYPPPPELLDQVAFAINPQAHAFDNRSVMETLPMQAAVVENARRLGGGKPVLVSPVTLKPRFNPYAGAAAAEGIPGALPAAVDRRQMSLFGAAWTLGSFAYLAAARASSVTYFETAGWRGVLERPGGSPMPELFRSLPGGVFPLYHVLADIGEFSDGELLPSNSSDPGLLAGVVLRKPDRVRVVLANLGEQARDVDIQAVGSQARLRIMDERNAERAMREPELFRSEKVTSPVEDGMLQLALLPYAVACIDMQPGASAEDD